MCTSAEKNRRNADADATSDSGVRLATVEPTGAVAATTTTAVSKVGEHTAWDRRIRIASCASFLLGCVWVLLFPLMTLTTGESKPRGTFFDENAMLVHHTVTKLTPANVDWAKPARLREAYPQQVKAWCGNFHLHKRNLQRINTLFEV